ncbi:MAG: heavy-metal-associated domain-containing protein, partial [Saprospiraceae bacterium]
MNKFVIWVILSITLPVLGFSQDEVLVEYNFRVEGACGMCQDRIETTASKLEGVKVAQWDLASHIMRLVIDENKNSVSEVRLAIANAGHDNGDFKAP